MFNKIQFLVLVTIIVASCGKPLSATDVTGKVRLQASANHSHGINRYPGRQSVAVPNDHTEYATTQAVVFLSGGKAFVAPADARHEEMKQVNQEFVPHLLPILVGTTVDFPNMDPVFHNVFSYSKTKKFDLGRYSKGHSKSVTFDKPGVVKVFCEIHSTMLAHILVLEQPYFTITERDGSFRISDVPPGEYDLHIWQENAPEVVRTVQVPDQNVFVVEVQQ